MLTTTERPLTPAELRALASRIGQARREGRDTLVTIGVASLAAAGLLGALTFAASRSSSWMVMPFWVVAATMVSLWIGLPGYRATQQPIASLDDAIRASRVKTTRVQSSHVVEFENGEEGVCYAFEVDASTCLFVVGRQFRQDDFPNSDFSIVELLGTRGLPVDSTLEKAGHKLTPERVVPASIRQLVEIPEHMTIVQAEIARVEHALGKPTGRGYA